MRIEILGTESLGVRGLSCMVEVNDRRILIDPGIALGYSRYGLLPHPFQVAVGRSIRKRIISAAANATDVVISHYHGDHIPLVDANPYQLKIGGITDLLRGTRFWVKGLNGLSLKMKNRAESLANVLNRNLENAEGKCDGSISFSRPVPHGEANSFLGEVMMTRIEDEGNVFVHASDIQLLSRKPVSQILKYHQDIVFVSGPPLYLHRLSAERRRAAWRNAVALSREVDTLILDHHIIRFDEGLAWLKRVSSKTGKRVLCAADFMKRPRLLLEAWRKELYREMPVPENWHRDYARGKADLEPYKEWRGNKA